MFVKYGKFKKINLILPDFMSIEKNVCVNWVESGKIGKIRLFCVTVFYTKKL